MLSAVATVLPTAYTGAPGYYRSSKPNISLRATTPRSRRLMMVLQPETPDEWRDTT
jgi:hypothetical protein